MSAQLSMWVAAHRGDLDISADALEKATADLSVAHAMSHRRRAGIARILTEFFDGVGPGFGPYLEGRVPDVPLDAAHEIAEGHRATALARGRYATSSPLLYERALLADLEGRRTEALRDLEPLLDRFPGFFRGAIQAARLLLANGEPERAIWILAKVEFEAGHTREGAGILADALRAAGYHDDARRYDHVSMTALGHHDSRGNDCAPVDVSEDPVADHRMPLPYSLQWIGNRLLANERGNYYLVSADLSGFHLADLLAGRRIPVPQTDEPGVQQAPTPRWVALRGAALRFGRSAMDRLRSVRSRSAPAQPAASPSAVEPPTRIADFEVLDLDQRVSAGRQRLEEGLSRIFGQGLTRGAGVVGEPFMLRPEGWSGQVMRRPDLWTGAEYHLFVGGEYRGRAALSAVGRVVIGERHRSLAEIRLLETVVVVAESWTLQPPFQHVAGLSWMASLPDLAMVADRPSDGERSCVSVFEDALSLPHPHAAHSEIASLGGGRFSHWDTVVYFSTTDASDPNTNGKAVKVLLTSRVDAVENRLQKSSTVGRPAFRKITPPFRYSKQGWVGLLPDRPARGEGNVLQLMVDGERVGTTTLIGTDEVSVGMGAETFDTVMGRVFHVFAAQERRLDPPFDQVRGLMWGTPLADLMRFADDLDDFARSSLLVCEDGRGLPHPHAVHDDVADLGGGRFSHWTSTLYFSTTDGSDPNVNGRVYSILISQPDPEPGADPPSDAQP